MTAGWYEGDTRFIPGHYQPGVLIDLALGRGLDSHRVLRGTGLFHDDFPSGTVRLSPQQFLQLIANAWPLLGRDETAFLYGQRLLPGHYGAASQALAQAAHLQEALEVLVEQQALLSPLLKPRVQMDEGQVQLAWLDACGCGEVQRFVLEASMAAVASACHWLAGERLPGASNSATRARATSSSTGRTWATRCASTAARPHAAAARVAAPALAQGLGDRGPGRPPGGPAPARYPGMEASLLGRLHDHLEAHIREPLNLERVAAAFGLSPATLKRRLQKHGTHFQVLLDQARLQVALDLYESRGYTNDEVAAYLRFNDTTNFRRSFKRWAGASPSALRHVLGLVS